MMRSPGRVARVRGQDFSAWVILQVDRLHLADADIQPGDLVRVWTSGAHVLFTEINWERCSGSPFGTQVSNVEYCAQGSVLDDGLVGLDSGYKLSPSNELIRAGRIAQRWQAGALFWHTSRIETP